LVQWEKRRDKMEDFDANIVNLFRVVLEPTTTDNLEE